MNKAEYGAWVAETEKSEHKWQMDLVHNTSNDCLFYKGGTEHGHYIHIKQNVVEIGDYQGAFPHIGEALFTSRTQVQCKDNQEAWTRLLERGGMHFLIAIFQNNKGDKSPVMSGRTYLLGNASISNIQ